MRRFLFSAALLALLSASPVRAIVITRYAAVPYLAAPVSISATADGDVVFTSPSECAAVVVHGDTGEYDYYRDFDPGECPTFVAASPDGHIWTTHPSANLVKRWTYEYATTFTSLTPGSAPYGIVFGPDGAAWFAEYNEGKIGRVRVWASDTEQSDAELMTRTGHPSGIAAAGGYIWVTESTVDRVARINPEMPTLRAGYQLPAGSFPWMICRGPDGAVYFTEKNRNLIGRMPFEFSGFEEFEVPTPNAGLDSIALGPDGNLWFTEFTANKIGRMTPAGAFTEWALPAGSHPKGITADSRGHIWFVENGTNRLARITLPAPGDVNWDGATDVMDVFYLINFLFAAGPPPAP